MELAELFDLIRKEPVCLFIGSGFSLYAGMPSATGLIDLLYDTLSVAQQRKIEKSKDLRKFTEDYETLFTRPKLIRELQQQFDVTPKDSHIHDLLGKISYFKSIITTNYDRLLEDAFGERATAVVNNQQIFGSTRTPTRILKIHGDIRDGKSLVVTKTDYSNQYNRDFKDPFWATVISEISAHHVVFLGFGYEDENVQADFEYIQQKLKSKDKKRVLLSPNSDPVKLKRYQKLGIQHIRSNGEDFVNGLISVLKANIKKDLSDKYVDQQTASDFITAFDDLVVDIKSTKYSAELVDIKKTTGPTQQTLQISTVDDELKAALARMTTGYSQLNIEITPDQLESFNFLIEGFNILDKESLGTLSIALLPRFEGLVKLKFPHQLFSLRNIHCRVFNNIPGKVRIEVDVAGFQAEFNLEFIDGSIAMNFNAKEAYIPAPINKTYEVFRCFYLLFSGEAVEITTKDGKTIKHSLTGRTQAAEFKKQMEFLHMLKKIEKEFAIKFNPVKLGTVTDDERENVAMLRALIDHGYYAVKRAEGITIEEMPNSPAIFESFNNLIPGTYVSILVRTYADIILFGRKLMLGNQQITLKSPTPTELNFEALRMTLLPSDDILIYHYRKFGLNKMKGAKTVWPREDGLDGELAD